MTRLFIHNPFFRIFSGPIFGVMVYLLILLINNTVEDIDKIYSHEELYVCIALSYISFETIRLTLKILDRNLPDEDFRKRILVRVFAGILVSLGLISVAISAYFRFVEGFSIGSTELNLFLTVYGFTGLLYTILYFSHYYLLRENKTEIDRENRLREKVEADFSSFRNDINPDLLYESLENLILTVHVDTDRAEEQIDSLAGIYRYSLVNRQQELVTLQDELDAVENLLHLLNHKYSDSIRFINSVLVPAEIHLIPGSLMVTIDSIVRNTLISKKSQLVIQLYAEEDDDYIVLQHTLNDRLIQHSASMNSFLQLHRSYLFFSDKPFVQVKAGYENFIKFPLVRVQQTIGELS
jgi:sensor histidine kinase YesM